MIRALPYVLGVLMLCTAGGLHAQDARFSQYYTSSLFLNPTFAGIPSDLQVSINHKRQFQTSGIKNELSQFSLLYPFVTKGFNARQFGGVGVTAFNQDIGQSFYRTNGVMISTAYNVRLGLFSPDYVIFGLQGGYFNESINFGNLQWGSQYTPYLVSGFDPNAADPSAQFNEYVRYPTLNVGITYYYNPAKTYRLYDYSAFSGFSFRHLNRPNASFMGSEEARKPLVLTYHGGFEFNFSHKFQWSPNAIFIYEATNKSYEFNVGNYISYSLSDNRSFNANNLYLTLGAWYRLRDSFIFTTGFQNKNLQVAFSYDLNKAFIFTEENEATIPSFEISLTYTAGKDKKGGRSSNPLF